jgi:hypothetical protein
MSSADGGVSPGDILIPLGTVKMIPREEASLPPSDASQFDSLDCCGTFTDDGYV